MEMTLQFRLCKTLNNHCCFWLYIHLSLTMPLVSHI